MYHLIQSDSYTRCEAANWANDAWLVLCGSGCSLEHLTSKFFVASVQSNAFQIWKVVTSRQSHIQGSRLVDFDFAIWRFRPDLFVFHPLSRVYSFRGGFWTHAINVPHHWIGEYGRAQSADQTLSVLSSSSFLSYSAPSSFSSDFLFSTTTHNCRSLLLMVLLRLTFFWKFKKNSCCWCDPEKVRDWIVEHSTHFGMKQQRLSFHICEAARPGALQPNPKMKAGNHGDSKLGTQPGGSWCSC